MIRNQQWPAPHKTRGAAVDKTGAADMLGWRGRSTVDVQMSRTRMGRLIRVPFPAPAGYAIRSGPHWTGDASSRHMVPYWWLGDIDAYRRACAAPAEPTQRTEQ